MASGTAPWPAHVCPAGVDLEEWQVRGPSPSQPLVLRGRTWQALGSTAHSLPGPVNPRRPPCPPSPEPAERPPTVKGMLIGNFASIAANIVFSSTFMSAFNPRHRAVPATSVDNLSFRLRR